MKCLVLESVNSVQRKLELQLVLQASNSQNFLAQANFPLETKTKAVLATAAFSSHVAELCLPFHRSGKDFNN